MTIAGAPFVLIGHDGEIAFTTTSEQIVNQHVFQEQVDVSTDPPTQLFQGEKVPLTVLRHAVKVSGEAQPRAFVSYRSTHGPIFEIDEEKGIAYATKVAAWQHEQDSLVGFAGQAFALLPPGESGFLAQGSTPSPHLGDQIALFDTFRYKPMTLDRAGP